MAKYYVIEKGDLKIVLAYRFARTDRWQVQVRGELIASGIGVGSLAEQGWDIVDRLNESNATQEAGDLRALLLGMANEE